MIKRWVALIAFILTMFLPAIPVQAETPEDAVITLQSQHVYRNMAEADDMEIVFHFRWSTGNASSTPASSAMLISLSYNGTIIASRNPYVFPDFADNGWGDGMVGFYLSANSSPVWGGAYTITIMGLPAYFSPPPLFTYTLVAADYSSLSDQQDEREEMRDYIFDEIDIFKTIYPSVTLKASTDMGVFLSSDGESYFTEAIPGLMSINPLLFFSQVYTPATMAVQAYDTSLPTQLTSRAAATDMNRGFNRIGTRFGVSGGVVAGVIAFAGCLFVVVKTSKAGWPIEAGLFLSAIIMTGAAVLVGNLIFTIVMIMAFLALLGLGQVLYGKRA